MLQSLTNELIPLLHIVQPGQREGWEKADSCAILECCIGTIYGQAFGKRGLLIRSCARLCNDEVKEFPFAVLQSWWLCLENSCTMTSLKKESFLHTRLTAGRAKVFCLCLMVPVSWSYSLLTYGQKNSTGNTQG